MTMMILGLLILIFLSSYYITLILLLQHQSILILLPLVLLTAPHLYVLTWWNVIGGMSVSTIQ